MKKHHHPVTDALGCLDEETIRACMSEDISPRDRRIFLLRYFRFCSHREIGDRVGMRENTVNMRLTRMRKKLRDALLRRGIFL